MTETLKLAVNGTLMRDLELNENLLNVGAEFLCEATTTPNYRLWSINDVHPAMVRVAQGGHCCCPGSLGCADGRVDSGFAAGTAWSVYRHSQAQHG